MKTKCFSAVNCIDNKDPDASGRSWSWRVEESWCLLVSPQVFLLHTPCSPRDCWCAKPCPSLNQFNRFGKVMGRFRTWSRNVKDNLCHCLMRKAGNKALQTSAPTPKLLGSPPFNSQMITFQDFLFRNQNPSFGSFVSTLSTSLRALGPHVLRCSASRSVRSSFDVVFQVLNLHSTTSSQKCETVV